MHILIITPQRNELEYLLTGMRQQRLHLELLRLGKIEGARVPALDTTVAVGGNGKAQFAAQTQYLISRCPDTRLVICTGAAGSLVGPVSMGHVVIATHTIEHDFRERFVDGPLPTHAGHSPTIEQLRTLAAGRAFPFSIHF